MPRIDPPYPSFAFVVTQMDESRHGHSHRHQSPAKAIRQRLEDAFTVIDSPTSPTPPTPAQPQLRPTTHCIGRVDSDVSSFELDEPAVGAEPEEDTAAPTHSEPQHHQLGRTKLAEVFTEFVGILCRRLAVLVTLDAHAEKTDK